MPLSPEQLSVESERASKLLAGKVVSRILRHREKEVLVEFTDGSRLFVDKSANGVDLSITGVSEE